jgi:hypothetical protein
MDNARENLDNELGGQFTVVMRHFRKAHAVAWLIEVLCYKPEGRSFDYR